MDSGGCQRQPITERSVLLSGEGTVQSDRMERGGARQPHDRKRGGASGAGG